MKKKLHDTAWKFVINGLIILGICLVFWPFFEGSIITIKLADKDIHLLEAIPDEIEEETITTPSLSLIDEMSEKKEVDAAGFITIDALNFHQPLLIGLTNANLLLGGVAMYPERTLASDNFVVIGHNMGIEHLLFGDLTKATADMRIEVNYLGESKVYFIREVIVIDETDTQIMENEYGSQLTLITCSVGVRTTERVVVIADPIEKTTRNDEEQVQTIGNRRFTQIEYWKYQSYNLFVIIGLILFLLLVVIYMINKWLNNYKKY